jgi:hypothetical protein
MWSSERGRACAAGALVLATITSGPRTALAQAAVPPATPAPPGSVASAAPPAAPRPRSALVWGGASLFALSYGASAFSATTGYTADDSLTSSRTAMWVPLLGPFIALGSTRSAGDDTLLLLDGLAQIAGLTLFIYGLASSAPAVSPRDASSHRMLALAPLADPRAPGASLRGTF